jgi:hypothetical protein
VFRHRSRRFALVIVAVASLAAACANSDPPGLTVDAVQADIVFGVETPEVGEVPPPTGVPGDAGNPDAADGSLRVPFRNTLPDRFSNVSFTVPPGEAAEECPSAPITETPDTAAPDNASAPPAGGLYRWQRSGTQKYTIDGTAYESAISGLETRLVRAVDASSDTRWTFEVVQPDLSGATLVTTYSVNTAAVQRGAAAPYIGNTTRAGEPGRGLSLERMEFYDGNGVLVGEFDPPAPMLWFPLPVLSGDTFTSVGVDPKSGQSMRLQGQVARRESIDACGERLDAWLVDGSLSIAGAETVTRELHYYVATGMGAMIIGERIKETSELGTLDVFYEIGQRVPDPEPASN